MTRDSPRARAHAATKPAASAESLREIHEAATLGVDRPPAGRELADALDRGDVGGEPPRVQLGIAAAEVEPIHVGDRVRQRTPEDQLGSGGAQPIEVLRVVELERDIARDSDLHANGDFGRGIGAAGARKRLSEREQLVQIDRGFDEVGELPAALGSEDAFGGGDEAEVALGQADGFVAGHAADGHRSTARPDRCFSHSPWIAPPTRLAMTAATRSSGSNVSKPRTTAAALRA